MKLFAGSYTEYLAPELDGKGSGVYIFDFDDRTGALRLAQVIAGRNTSFLSVSPSGKRLYTFQEIAEEKHPKALAYDLTGEQAVLIGQQELTGGLPCHCSLLADRGLFAVACYQTGHVQLFELSPAGGLGDCVSCVEQVGTSVNAARQERAHAHQVVYNQADQLLYVPDLGCDKVFVYAINEHKQLCLQYAIRIPAGEGPRHMCFHPNGKFAFVSCELTGNLICLRKESGQYVYNKSIASLPADSTIPPSASAIHLSKSGQYIFMGNRSTNTISIVSVNAETGELAVVGHQCTEGLVPRDFVLSPEGNYLLVGNQDSHTIVVFSFDEDTAKLTQVAVNNQAKSVVCLKFIC